jgi:hypothetical protein
VAAGLAGGVTFALGMLVTFGLLGGSRPGQEGLLFDPDSQHPKVITVWKELEPLPRIIDTPAVILGGMVLLGVGYAFLYRSVADAWPARRHGRVIRLALIIWMAGALTELMGPFNVLHQPLRLSALALTFWAGAALAEAYVVVLLLDGVSRGRPGTVPAGPGRGRPGPR